MDEIAKKDCGYLELILGCMFSGKNHTTSRHS